MQLANLFSYSGRIGRREYWLLQLGYMLASAPLLQLATRLPPMGSVIVQALLAGMGIWIMSAYTARRLHDTDRSGWWQLWVWAVFGAMVGMASILAAVGNPIVGLLLVILLTIGVSLYCLKVLGFESSFPGDNAYGSEGSGSLFPE